MIFLPARILDIRSVEPVAMVSRGTASKLKLRHTMILGIKNNVNGKLFAATPIVTEGITEEGVIAISQNDAEWLKVNEGDEVFVSIRRKPISLDYVKEKMEGKSWSTNQVYTLVNEISKRNYTHLELATFALTSYFRKFKSEEIVALAKSMAENGTQFNFDETSYDKHSIGGIPGNKVSLVLVPIVAAAGLLIPKTSSRAITSPSGTADSMEVLANVSFNADELAELAPKSRGMIVWNAPLKIVPMDEIVIGVKKYLDIDPRDQMLTSIIATKIALSVDHLVIDLPTGPGSKIENEHDGRSLANKFMELCLNVGIDTEAILTFGSQPLGYTIGPALEAKEALEVLEGKQKQAVYSKSVELAGTLLEMGKIASPGEGAEMAAKLIQSNKALEKMKEIIEIQGGDRSITSEKITVGNYSHTINAKKNGSVAIQNYQTKKVGCATGAPATKCAGLSFHVRPGKFVKQGTPLFTIYSDSEGKLSDAIKVALNDPPVKIEGMVIRRFKNIIKPKTF